MLKTLNFDVVFKTILLFLIAYFLFLLTNIAKQLKIPSDIGRYQFHTDKEIIIDTKTGETKYANPE